MTAIDFNALVLFKVVVEAGNLTRAAAATRLSISTISRRLAGLEHDLGAALLERTPRRLSLTPLGHTLIEYARRIAAEGQAAYDVATETRAGVSGTLRVSVPAEFGQAWLGRAAAAFMVAHPDIVLEIKTNNGVVDFAKDECEVAIVLRRLPNTRMVRKRLADLQRGLFASPAYLKQHGIPRSLEALSAHRCLITELQRDDQTWSLTNKRRFRNVGSNWHATVANIGLLRELVLGGAGIGMLNDALCQGDLRAGRVVRLLPEWQGPPLVATAVIPSHRLITRRSRLFVDFVHAHMQLRD